MVRPVSPLTLPMLKVVRAEVPIPASVELDFESPRSHTVEDDTDERNTMPTTWFINGTSSGFGRQLTEGLLARGDRVAATLRQPEALDDLRAEHGERVWVARLDVTDTE